MYPWLSKVTFMPVDFLLLVNFDFFINVSSIAGCSVRFLEKIPNNIM